MNAALKSLFASAIFFSYCDASTNADILPPQKSPDYALLRDTPNRALGLRKNYGGGAGDPQTHSSTGASRVAGEAIEGAGSGAAATGTAGFTGTGNGPGFGNSYNGVFGADGGSNSDGSQSTEVHAASPGGASRVQSPSNANRNRGGYNYAEQPIFDVGGAYKPPVDTSSTARKYNATIPRTAGGVAVPYAMGGAYYGMPTYGAFGGGYEKNGGDGGGCRLCNKRRGGNNNGVIPMIAVPPVPAQETFSPVLQPVAVQQSVQPLYLQQPQQGYVQQAVQSMYAQPVIETVAQPQVIQQSVPVVYSTPTYGQQPLPVTIAAPSGPQVINVQVDRDVSSSSGSSLDQPQQPYSNTSPQVSSAFEDSASSGAPSSMPIIIINNNSPETSVRETTTNSAARTPVFEEIENTSPVVVENEGGAMAYSLVPAEVKLRQRIPEDTQTSFSSAKLFSSVFSKPSILTQSVEPETRIFQIDSYTGRKRVPYNLSSGSTIAYLREAPKLRGDIDSANVVIWPAKNSLASIRLPKQNDSAAKVDNQGVGNIILSTVVGESSNDHQTAIITSRGADQKVSHKSGTNVFPKNSKESVLQETHKSEFQLEDLQEENNLGVQYSDEVSSNSQENTINLAVQKHRDGTELTNQENTLSLPVRIIST